MSRHAFRDDPRLSTHRRRRAWFPVLLLASLVAVDPARAGTVTAPAGGTQLATAPLTVQWSGIGTSGAAVGIEMTAIGPGGSVVTGVLEPSVANTGQRVVPSVAYRNLACVLLPQVLGLDHSMYTYASVPVGQVQFLVRVRSLAAGNAYATGAPFRIKCPTVLGKPTVEHGEIAIAVRPGGRPHIGPLSHAVGTLHGAATSLPGDEAEAWARVQKIVVNATGADVAMPSSFAIGGLCSGGQAGPGGLGLGLVGLTVRAGAGQWQSFGAGSDATCSAFEAPPAPIANARGCEGGRASWTVSVVPAQVYRNTTSTDITVTNTLACDRPVDTGSLVVIKQVVHDATIPPPDVPFLVDVSCQPGGPTTTLKLSASGGLRETVGGIRLGSDCTITERPPEVPADLARRGCRWETRYPGDRRVPVSAREGASVTIVNQWACKPGAGRGSRQ